MKNFILIFAFCLALAACKKEETQQAAIAPIQDTAAKNSAALEKLAAKSLAGRDDWTKDLSLYIGDVMACVKAVPGQTKYVFRADAFENPSVALVLLKTEADTVYACSFKDGLPPQVQEIHAEPSKSAPRFYPEALPKADSCLQNTRVLDKSGHVAGWLAKITC